MNKKSHVDESSLPFPQAHIASIAGRTMAEIIGLVTPSLDYK